MDPLDALNRLADDGFEFRIASFTPGVDALVLLASHDFSYSHGAEIIFTGVELIHCPTSFDPVRFQDGGPQGDGRRFEIEVALGEARAALTRPPSPTWQPGVAGLSWSA